MDRQISYPFEVLLDTDLLNMNKNAMVGLGYAIQDILGASTLAAGFPCTQTTVASLAVLVGPGRIYALENVDGTAYGSLPADITDQVMKQGIQLASVTLATPAPVTAGQSINYLIEAAYQDVDTTAVVPPFYNAGNPAVPFPGQNGLGAPLPTQRKGTVILQAKPGIPAATGSQTTPAPDAGFVPLYVVFVSNGQATVTAANIVVAPGSPFINSANAAAGVSTLTNNLGTSANGGGVVEEWIVSQAAANQKIWQWSASCTGASANMALAAVPDSGLPTGLTAFAIGRSGSAINGLNFGNATDNPIFQFFGTGLMEFPNVVPAASATAGTAGALPATPAGYMLISVGGGNKKLALYNV